MLHVLHQLLAVLLIRDIQEGLDIGLEGRVDREVPSADGRQRVHTPHGCHLIGLHHMAARMATSMLLCWHDHRGIVVLEGS